MNWKITLSEPDIGIEELEAVKKVFASNWFTMGSITLDFENKFAQMTNTKYAFAVTNCTAALHLANLALGIIEGDEVIVPALTFVASANASRYTGAKVVFADSISENDLTVCPEHIESLITERTKAITVVHYAGFSCDMKAVLNIAKKYDLKIIEDCAHSPLAQCELDGGKLYLGGIGDIGCFSFFGNKNMTTAEGGMITTNDDELATKLKLLRSHGMTSLTFDRHKGHQSGYDVVSLGLNYRIDELRSAIGLVQLDKLENFNEQRREVFKLYVKYLSGNDNIIVPFKDRDLNLATPHIMPVIVKNSIEKIKSALKEAGIQTSKHYDLIPTFTLYRDEPFTSQIEHIENILTLPMSQKLTEEDVKYICCVINSI
ncbi:MAG: DegT/DnrJ/EryC1/StrS aminotransferase family protein [Candidatus Delongbacteria bacterium]|nr:DegT/DnrJ/EryC1/StrS aminotransferase family protein [Candidatus Delongbacteria bacterium]